MHRNEQHREPKRIEVDPEASGRKIGFSPYRQSISMTRTPSTRDLNRKARKQGKRDIERGDA